MLYCLAYVLLSFVAVLSFMLNPEWETTIANMEYDFSIWADYQNEFELNNKQIPADSRFHTFVIDSTNNVVLIGNPVYNKKIRQLYQSYFKQ